MPLTFTFERVSSTIFGTVHRPVAWVEFWSKVTQNWIGIWMVVDSGADYSLLPNYMGEYLGIDPHVVGKTFSTLGIGGSEKVFLVKEIKVRLGEWEMSVPVGFLDKDTVPPLLGRQGFMENFATLFFQHKTFFSKKPPKF